MVKDIQNKCDKVIENYREAKDSLRFDGDCINHLCAVIYGVYERDIPAEDIKYINYILYLHLYYLLVILLFDYYPSFL